MKRIVLMSVILFSLLGMNAVQAFDQMIVFGDSLSDEGYQNNNPAIKAPNPTKTPVWTSPNGHTWAYYLAEKMGISPPTPNNLAPLKNNNYVTPDLQGTDYAAGGATSGAAGFSPTPNLNYSPPSLIQQVCQYTAGTKQDYAQCTAPNMSPSQTDPNALYSIFIGANDIFSAIGTTYDCGALTDSLASNIVNNIVVAINKLQSTSSVPLYIMVIGLPDIGSTPLGIKILPFAGCPRSIMSGFIAKLDTLELSEVNSINASGSSHVIYIGTFSMMDSLQNNYPFANANSEACQSDEDSALTCIPTKPDAQNYMFEDLVHPTNLTHTLFAGQIYADLQGAGWVS